MNWVRLGFEVLLISERRGEENVKEGAMASDRQRKRSIPSKPKKAGGLIVWIFNQVLYFLLRSLENTCNPDGSCSERI